MMSNARVYGNHSAASPSSLAERLRALRLRKGLSQRTLAEMAEISGIQYGRYEQGRNVPSADTLRRLADILETSGDYLLEGQSQGTVKASMDDQELLQMFQELQGLPTQDKEVIKIFLNAFLVKKKIQALAG